MSSDAEMNSMTGFPGWQGSLVSGIFALAATILSVYLMKLHLEYFVKPVYQKHIVRILLMVPIYSITAWLTYLTPNFALSYDLIRSCYEAFVIYEFFTLLLAYLGDGDIERRRILSNKEPGRLLAPFCCYSYNPNSQFFLMDVRLLINQYVVIRPLTTVLALIMEANGHYHAESLDPRYGNFWFTIMNFLSVSISMYALILFFMVIRYDISEYRPLNKFLSVKFVVFMTFWQSLIIGALARFGAIPDTKYWSAEHTAIQTQSFLLCVEMFLASLWHMHSNCFGVQDFRKDCETSTHIGKSLAQCFNPSEYLYDVWLGVKHVFARLHHFIRSRGHEEVLQTDVETSIAVSQFEHTTLEVPSRSDIMTLTGNAINDEDD